MVANLLDLREVSRQPAVQMRSGQAPVSIGSTLGVQKNTEYRDSENRFVEKKARGSSAASISQFPDEDEDHLSHESEYDDEDDQNGSRSVNNAGTLPGEGQDDDAHEGEDMQ